MSFPAARGPRPVREPGALTQRWRFEATGTRWEILTTAPLPLGLRDRLVMLSDSFEDAWSRFRPGSLVRRAADGGLGAGPLDLDLPPGSAVLLDLYDRLHRATGGRVDPLVGADLVELGYDPEYSFVVRRGGPPRGGAGAGRGPAGPPASRTRWCATRPARGGRRRGPTPARARPGGWPARARGGASGS